MDDEHAMDDRTSLTWDRNSGGDRVMESATTVWVGNYSPLRSRRQRPSRRRVRTAIRRVIAIITKVTLGLMLVGCSTIPAFKIGSRQTDPLAAIQSGATGNDRIAAYRELGSIEKLSPEAQALARTTLIEGAATEYNVLPRSAAVASLASYQGQDVLDTLLKAGKDRNPIVRVEACRALKNQHDPAADELLKQLATADADPDVRMAAAGALVSANDPAAIDALILCLRDEELAVARRAADGLRSMTGADIQSDDYTQWQQWVAEHPNLQSTERTAAKPDRSGLFDIFRR